MSPTPVMAYCSLVAGDFSKLIRYDPALQGYKTAFLLAPGLVGYA